MTDFIEYIFTDRQTKWRVNWYNEIKIPMLTAAILFDNGYESLNQKVDILFKIVTSNKEPDKKDNIIMYAPEEEFI